MIINTHDWDLKIFGGLCKNKIRDLSEGIFDNNFIFATCKKLKNTENNQILTIELSNADINKLDDLMGHKYSEKLTFNSETHYFKFKQFKCISKKEDLHEFEPSKITIGTFKNIKHVYIILDVFKND